MTATASRRRPRRLAAAALACGLLLTACGSSLQVRWDTYAGGLQQSIDSAAASRDCAALSQAHQQAVDTNDAHKKATGIDNRALKAYISDRKAEAGCA